MVTISNAERADIKEDFFEAEKVAKQNIEDVKTSNDKDDKQKASQQKEAQPKEPTPLGPILPPPPPGPIDPIYLINREKTKEDLKLDYEIAKAKLERLQSSRTKINYIERDEKEKSGRGGFYTTGKGTITIHPENIARTEGELTIKTVLQHERQHEIFDYATITTSDGKTCKALEAPMSLAQNYKLNQAKEVGAYITELLTKRQEYIDVHETRDGVKDELIKSLQKSADKPRVKELIEAVKNNQEITSDGNGNCSFKVGNEKVTVNLPEEPFWLSAYNRTQERVKEMEKQIGEWSEDKRHGWYFKGVMNKTYNPLSKDPNTLKGELDNIGRGCAVRWQEQLGSTYSKQVKENTESYFKKSNFQDIKQNDENYNKALSAGLTIGGYDFSNAVKGYLDVPEAIKKIDKEIANGTNKLDVMDKAAKEGVNLRKDDSENDIKDRMVAYLVKDKKITGKETVLEEKYVWTAEMIEKYKKGKENYEKDCKEGKYTKEQRDILDEKWEKIKNLDNKKPGEEGSEDELNNVLSIYTAYRTAKVYDRTEVLDIYDAADKQIDSNKVSEKEKDEYKKAYDKVKKEGDVAFEDLSLGSIKDDVNKVLSGRENSVDKELTKEQVSALKEQRDSMDTSQEKRAIKQEGGKLKSASIYDFTKPIVDPNRQKQIEQAKKDVERAQKRYEEATSKTPSQDNNKTQSQGNNQTNTKAADAKVVAAYKANQGR